MSCYNTHLTISAIIIVKTKPGHKSKKELGDTKASCFHYPCLSLNVCRSRLGQEENQIVVSRNQTMVSLCVLSLAVR
jgi:hypothetical protein